MVALNKKDGGVIPIAVGCTIRRLAAKCIGHHVMEDMGTILAPHQLGYGTKNGAEAAVHAARLFLQGMVDDQVMLKLDFKKAFNCIRRDKMLKAVEDLAPIILPFVASAYCSTTSLFWGGNVLDSAEGVQQGDPLGPLLFCLTVHALYTNLSCSFHLFYLDDGTLGGQSADVLQDLHDIEKQAEENGLHLNKSKSEVICKSSATSTMWKARVSDIQLTPPEGATLLGSSLGHIESQDQAMSEKIEQLKVMGNRLKYLRSQDALILLKNAMAIPKLLYLLRTSPCFLSTLLEDYDSLLLNTITNNNMNADSPAWLQASLPVRSGGLGIRRAAQLAPSAFLASAAGCSGIVSLILHTNINIASQPWPEIEAAMILWREGHGITPPPTPLSYQQRLWDAQRIAVSMETLLKKASDSLSRARLLSTTNPESGAWLNALPVPSLGLCLEDETICIAVGLRLDLDLCEPHECCNCGTEVNRRGLHGLSCRHSRGRHHRHAELNNIIHRAMTSANIPSRLEPTGMTRDDGKRPDGATLIPWKTGKPLVWDVTCRHPLSTSYIDTATGRSGEVAERAECEKQAKYSSLGSRYFFQPVAAETTGAMGPETLRFVKDLGHRIFQTTGEFRSTEYLFQRLSVAIQRGNAISLA